MYHQGDVFSSSDNWWSRHEEKYSALNINESEFSDFSMKKGFNKGDILFIIKATPEKLKIGDIIIFKSSQKNPIIHRIISIKQENGEYIFSTVGDNNNGQLSEEIRISQNQLVGKAVFKLVPLAGWGKLIFFEHLKPETERGFCSEN